jgi:hypothetical protein
MKKVAYFNFNDIWRYKDMSDLKVISLEELKQQNMEVIPLSAKVGGENAQIGVRVKRLSILGLCKNGKIPNPLLAAARQLFYNDKVETINLKDYGEIIDIISKEVLVSPSYDQFEELAPLTDDQKFELYIYSQRGLAGLEKFRKATSDNNDTESSSEVPNKTESDTGNPE